LRPVMDAWATAAIIPTAANSREADILREASGGGAQICVAGCGKKSLNGKCERREVRPRSRERGRTTE